MTADLVAFLNARLDEREKVAKAAAARVRRWPKTGPRAIRPPWVQARAFAQEMRQAALEAFEGRETPDEVLADVAAKRAIVNAMASALDDPWTYDTMARNLAEDALLELARVFAGHPDFDDSWRP